jgi:hypothetical protein
VDTAIAPIALIPVVVRHTLARMRLTSLLLIGILLLTLEARADIAAANSPYKVREYGARGDGTMLDTAFAQKAIDACAAGGGGTVYFGPGTYLSGSLRLKSGVYLYLDAGATLKGSTQVSDYDKVEALGFKNDADSETSFFHFSLIWAEDAERIGVIGEGTIDSNFTKRHGPKTIAFKRCRFVDIKGLRLLNAPNYNISLLGTDYVNIDGVTILNGFADGIDPDACHNVRISNCHIESRDDAIVPKTSFSLGERRACENITVVNCFLASRANCFKLGTESGGDFKHITVANCVMRNFAGDSPGADHATSGISLESVDGANVEDVLISNISMYNACSPIFIRLGRRCRDNAPSAGSLKNVSISHVVALNASWTSSITGVPGYYPDGITLSDIRLVYAAAAVPAAGTNAPVPEQEKAYPTANMFGPLPAYGFYLRHVKNVVLADVQLECAEHFVRVPLTSKKRNNNPYWQAADPPVRSRAADDPGTALVADDVEGLDIDALHARASKKGEPVLQFTNVRDAFLRSCSAPADTGVYLDLRGEQTTGIELRGNLLQNAKTPLRRAPEVSRKAVRSSS